MPQVKAGSGRAASSEARSAGPFAFPREERSGTRQALLGQGRRPPFLFGALRVSWYSPCGAACPEPAQACPEPAFCSLDVAVLGVSNAPHFDPEKLGRSPAPLGSRGGLRPLHHCSRFRF